MPLSRYLVRNEYGLADPDLYRVADKDDPEALLEGVAMAGLVGVLRQLGDLAEFAAEMFHDLHEEVMATAARGHALIARVQQLEAEFPSAENTLLSQTTHIPFLYNSGIDWHPNIRMDENLVTQGDMPRFVMDSYEECRGPPRLFLLDKFDVAGAGACLKRYTDPSFCKGESAEFSIKKSEGLRERRIRKVKRRGFQWRNGDTPEVFPSSHAKLHQLLLEERIETGANDPERRVKLKRRQLDGFTREDRLKSYMKKFMDTYSSDTKAVHEISLDLVPVNLKSYDDSCQSGLEIVEIDTVSPSRDPFYRDKVDYASFNIPEVVKPSINESNEVANGRVVEIPGAYYRADADNLALINKDLIDEELAADTGSKSGASVGEYNGDDIASEIDHYVDALATLESETETDSDYRTKRDRHYLNSMKKMTDSDGSEEKQQQYPLLDYHSIGNSTISDDGSLLKKEIDSLSSSDNVSSSAGDATAKSSTVGPVSPLANGEKSFMREAQGNNIEEYRASLVAESMAKNPPGKSEFKELPWFSVNAGSALTKTEKEEVEQTDRESKGQAVVKAVPDDGSDHLMSVGICPKDEMADAGSDSSYDVSLRHSHKPEETSSAEYSRDGRSTLFGEMNSSSASSPAKPIYDLRQPVKATSDGFTLLQKSSVSVLNFPEPVCVPCNDNDSSQRTEEKSEDQICLSGVSQDYEQPTRTNTQMDSMAADDSDLAEPVIPGVTDINGIVEPKVSIAPNSEEFCTVVDHAERGCPAEEIHCPPEPLCFGNFGSAEQLEVDSSENIAAYSVDESCDRIVCDSKFVKTNMNRDDSSDSNLVVNPSQVDSHMDQVSKVQAPVLFDGQVAGAGISDSETMTDMEGLSKPVTVDKDESFLSLDAITNNDDCIAAYLDQPGAAPVSSTEAHLVNDISNGLQDLPFDDVTHGKDAASSETISADSSSELLPHAETKIASAGDNCLEAEDTGLERQSLSSVLDCSSTGYEESASIGDDLHHNSEGIQIQSLWVEAEVFLQNPMSCEMDDSVHLDSTACEPSSILDNVHETCLAEGSQASLLSSVECDQRLERTDSSEYHVLEDSEHVLDALSDVHTKTQFTLDKKVEMQGVDLTAKSFNAMEGAPHSLEYVEQILPPKDNENELCSNLNSVSGLCAPLSQPLEANILLQSGDYKVESQFVEREPSALSVSVPPPREPLVIAEVPVQSADHKLQSSWPGMERSPADFSSTGLLPVDTQACSKIENPRQSADQLQVNPPLFGTSPNPNHIKPGEMPPLPPLPPIQWRLGKNQQTSLAFGGLMQHPLGTLQRSMEPETSDNAGLKSQNYSRDQHQNPFLSLSGEGASFQDAAGYSGGDIQQPTDLMFSTENMSHEEGQQHTITADERLDVQLFTGSQNDLPVPGSGAEMDNFSSQPLESGLNTEDAISHTPALFEDVTQKETTVAHEQCEHISSPAEQEATAVDEQLEDNAEKQIATTSSQFEPPEAMQHGHQLSHGFVAPETQGIWSTDVFGARKRENVNGSLQKKIQRPRNPLIDAVVAVDKSKLRKVGGMVKPQDKPKAESSEQHLPQLRKVGERVKPQDKPKAESSEQHLPQLRKVGERVKPQDAGKAEDSSQNFPPLRKIGLRANPQDLPSAEDSVQHLPQLRKVDKRIEHQDETKAEDEKQSFLPLRAVGQKLKPQDGPNAENKDWLEQIRNQSFNLKPAATSRPNIAVTSRPNIQGRQTNLKVAAILEKANMIRQAMAGNDEDSDGWSE